MSQVKSTKSKNHKKEEKKKGSKNDEADSKKPDSASKDDESSTKKEKEPKKFLKIVGGREIKLQEHLRNPVHLGEFNAVNEKNEVSWLNTDSRCGILIGNLKIVIAGSLTLQQLIRQYDLDVII